MKTLRSYGITTGIPVKEAKYLLEYHVILVCKYHRKALVGNASQETIQRYIKNQG